MAARIEISTIVFDTRADIRLKQFAHFPFSKKIKKLFILDVYTIDKNFSKKQLEEIGSRISNPVTQAFTIKSHKKSITEDSNSSPFTPHPSLSFNYAIEIGFLPGVTDNISHTVKELAEDLLKIKFSPGEGVYTSQITFIQGDMALEEVKQIAESLYNPIIERASIKSYKDFVLDNGMNIVVPKVKIIQTPKVTEVNLNVSDEELEKIGKIGILNPNGTRRGPLALAFLYMKTIQKYFIELGRNPTDIELESIAQTWSEHCKHTIFNDPVDDIKNGLFKTYIKKATEEIRKKKSKKDFCVSVFTDNSGAIEFDKDWLITHKVETHNSPSALDPFGGAVTGIVGVNRDTLGFGLGAKPVANVYGFCFADPRINKVLYKGPNFTQKMLSARRIMDGVIDGVNAGGNQSGIPTPQGFIYFDERYQGKPVVFCGTVGLIPKKIQGKPSWVKKALPGDYIVVIGGRVGKDGIHGATFSSEAMDVNSPRTAVQIGDPITQKKLSDAIIKEAREMLLYNSITDNGAGGISCSVAEMAKESNGCLVDLEKVPLKYQGLEPWEIWISESQERMTLAVPEKNWKKFRDLMEKRGVEAVVIGEFTDSGKCTVKYNGKIIMDLEMDFLHNGLPKRSMKTEKPAVIARSEAMNDEVTAVRGEAIPLSAEEFNRTASSSLGVVQKDASQILLKMLSRLNIASYSFISQQYDYVVQAGMVLPPLQGKGRVNADTSVFRPVLTSQKGVILSQGMYPSYSEIDPYAMAGSSLDTAVRNIVAAGGNPDYIAILDNFCWCSANDPKRLYQLKLAAKACYDYSIIFETPFISGKDSMFNDFSGFDKNGNSLKISIPPTLLVSSIGVMDESLKSISLDTKNPEDLVYILGETFNELAGSEYELMIKDKGLIINTNVPSVDGERNKKLYKAFYEASKKDLIASSISLTRGGLITALAKKAIGGMHGLLIDIKNLPGLVLNNTSALFSESQGRIVVTINPANKKDFEKIFSGISFAEIGKVTKEQEFIVKGMNEKVIIDVKLNELTRVYRDTFKGF